MTIWTAWKHPADIEALQALVRQLIDVSTHDVSDMQPADHIPKDRLIVALDLPGIAADAMIARLQRQRDLLQDRLSIALFRRLASRASW